MSLDFYLYKSIKCEFCGKYQKETKGEKLLSNRVTHNLKKMAMEAGIYKCLWRPEENGFEKAEDLIPVLKNGIEKMRACPDKFKKLNPANGWGSYEEFLLFAEKIYECAIENKNAIIDVWR